MSPKKKKLPQVDNRVEEELPIFKVGESSVSKGTFIGHNGRVVEYTEDKNGQVEFYSANGVKVVIPHSPSQEACERFVRALLRIATKYEIDNKL